MILFERDPSRYRHWKLGVDGRVATLTLDVDEQGGLVPGYQLKLNSYDLGVDMELHDALQRIRFEHPEVGAVVITSGKERMFCAGGGYELALACDEIVMVDDRSSTVSLPEVPLLGVLPGTGGLTRLVDKRRVRRDLADLFCTSADGVRADRAKTWGIVDGAAPPSKFKDFVAERAKALAAESDRPASAQGIKLPPLEREVTDDHIAYRWVEVAIDRERRLATLTVTAPESVETTLAEIEAAGASWWPLAMARELDDALLLLRLNFLDIGLWVLKTRGPADSVLAADAALAEHGGHWFVREVTGMLRRTLARLEVSARSSRPTR